MADNTLFLTLRLFSATGGIEKVCRVAGKALYDNIVVENEGTFHALSMYDENEDADAAYFPVANFTGHGNRRPAFMRDLLHRGVGARCIILSHVHLLLPAVLIKIVSPRTRLLLIAHGIEVWQPAGLFKRWMMRRCDQVLAVSHFTKNKLREAYGLRESAITVLPNCLDPFLPAPLTSPKDPALAQQLGILPTDFTWMMLSRLAESEQQKGYDRVLLAMAAIQQDIPGIKYLMAGKYTPGEKKRIEVFARKQGVFDKLVFSGFVPPAQVATYFRLADGYIMPSKKEGFGIVLIEALYYGLPVIAGNKDGSTDALANGRFGLLVDPDNVAAIKAAMLQVMQDRNAFIPDREVVVKLFGFETYSKAWGKLLAPVLRGVQPAPVS